MSTVDSVGSATQLTNGGTIQKKDSNSNLSMDDFFTLLAAELKYQDPTNPTTNDQFMSEMAQFSLLSQVQSLSKSLNASVASSAVGKNVLYTTQDSSGNSVQKSGTIDAVDISSSTQKYHVNDTWIDATSVTQFYSDKAQT